MNHIRFFSVLLLVFLTGCATVEEARRVQSGEEIPIGERTPTAVEVGLSGDKEVTLSELEEIALRVNPSIRHAVNAVNMSYLAVKMVKADFLPAIGAEFGHSRSTANRSRHNYDYDTYGTWSGAVGLELMIYDFGKTDAAVKASLEEYKAALQALRNAQNQVVYAVRTAYFQLHRAIELDKVAKETVAQYKQHMDHVQIKNEVGSGIPFDLTKAKVDYNNAILREIAAANRIQIAKTSLIHAIGLAEEASFSVKSVKLKEYELDATKLMAMARQSEPGLASLVAVEQAAKQRVDKAINDLYPTFSLNLGGVLTGQSLSFPFIWNVTGAAGVSQTIFAGGRLENAIKLATLELKNARAAIASYEQSLYMRLRTASLNAKLAKEQLVVATQIEKQASEYFGIVSEQYNVGKASSLERTDAQVAWTGAKASTVAATYDYQDALAVIAQLTGDFPEYHPEDVTKPDFE